MSPTKAVLTAASLALLVSLVSPPLAAMPPGEAVRSISDADRIEGWTAIDNQRVIVDIATQDSYLHLLAR